MKPQSRRDMRRLALAATVAGIVLGGAVLHWQGRGDPGSGTPIDPRANPSAHARAMQAAEFDTRFRQAVAMLHARQHEHAIVALHRLLEIAPEVPEVHVNMGYALLGLGRHAAALDFFVGASELAPLQANAYYGRAVALEALGDLPGALGAMRTFIHLSPADEPWLPKARAALWEWQARSAK